MTLSTIDSLRPVEPEEKGASNIGLKEIFGVQESYKLPEIIMDTLLSDQAEDIIRKIKNEDIDIRDTFQEEQGDRKELKQDFTPDCICNLVAKLTEKGSCIDMCSGTGVLSKAVAKENGTQVEEYEYSTRTIPFALLDACVNGLEGNISHADCLRNAAWETYAVKQVGDISIPKKTEKREMGMYDNVIMNPPYSMKFPDAEEYQIMGFTIPKAKADYGFLLRGIERMKGRLIAILPHGVLFRGAGEGKIREYLIKNKLISAVIGLPDKLFLNTNIPVCLVIIEKESPDILFIDASKEFVKKSAQNDMADGQVTKIVEAFKKRKDIDKYAHVAEYKEVQKNDYNLNIPRYVDSFEEEQLPDIETILNNLKEIDSEEEKTRKALYEMLGDLTGSEEDMIHIKKHRNIIRPKRTKKEFTEQMELGDIFADAL